MYRCAVLAASFAATLTLAAPAQAQLQLQRNFPRDAYRGVMNFGTPPAIQINGQDALLGPGVRIRKPDNLLALTGDFAGYKAVVNYTMDFQGYVKDVWILRPDEIAKKPWPRNAEEAAEWAFDPVAQTWTKP